MAANLAAFSLAHLPAGARAALAGIASGTIAALLLQLAPGLPLELFARAAAEGVGASTGAEVTRVAAGWHVALRSGPIVVSTACSGSDFYVIVAALLGWRGLGARRGAFLRVAGALALAFPVAVLVNALRIGAVAQAHRWFIPLLPETAQAFVHLLVGVAVFLPALIALNLVLEAHARRNRAST